MVTHPFELGLILTVGLTVVAAQSNYGRHVSAEDVAVQGTESLATEVGQMALLQLQLNHTLTTITAAYALSTAAMTTSTAAHDLSTAAMHAIDKARQMLYTDALGDRCKVNRSFPDYEGAKILQRCAKEGYVCVMDKEVHAADYVPGTCYNWFKKGENNADYQCGDAPILEEDGFLYCLREPTGILRVPKW